MNYLKELKTTSLTNPESVVTWLEKLQGRNVKWKYNANPNQVVFKTDNYYYKAYAFNEVDKFNSLIRHAFAEVYRSYGIDWEIITIQTEKGFLDIERRESLEVCKDWYDDILINYADTLNLVEEKLCFNNITKQIQEQYKYVYKIKLMRHCVNKSVDYAVYKDKVILLDDADWFLYMLDEENKPIPTKNMFIKVNLFDEDYTFTQWFINPQKSMALNKIYEVNDKFFLFKRLDLITREASIRNDFQKMLTNNVNLLTSKDNNSSIVEDLSTIYSPFKKTFYCTDTLEGIDYLTHNRVAIRQTDINRDKTLWDDICYEYVNRNLCGINLYTSFYENSIYDLCELLNQAKLYSVEPINGFAHTGITLYVQWNCIKDNDVWEKNFHYIKQYYPKVKLVINVILNEPFIQSVLQNDIDLKTFKSECGAKILFGGCDDTPKDFLPKRDNMLKFFNKHIIDGKTYFKIYQNETKFDNDVKQCEHHQSDCLPYFDSDKCVICDLKLMRNI